MENSRKRFNVDSPSFTPSLLSGNGTSVPKKSTAISPKAVSAAPFQPRVSASSRRIPPWPLPRIRLSLTDDKGSNTSTPTARQEADWTVADVQEFVPQGFEGAHVVSWLCSHLPFKFPLRIFGSSTFVALALLSRISDTSHTTRQKDARKLQQAFHQELECFGQ